MANPYPPIPDGECISETPDGVQHSTGPNGGFHNLYDTPDKRPAIQGGDWQVRQPPHRPRDRNRDTV